MVFDFIRGFGVICVAGSIGEIFGQFLGKGVQIYFVQELQSNRMSWVC